MELTLLHARTGALGYGRYGVELHRSLTRMGVDVFDDLAAPDADRHPAMIDDGPRHRKQTNVVAWISTPAHPMGGWWDGQIPVLSTMWEATALPEGFRESFDSFDTVIVPSEQNVELFGRYHPRVRYVPLGVDPDVWRFVPRGTPSTEFVFLCGGSGERKGIDLAVAAFRRVFPDGSWPKDGPVPKLVLKGPKPEDHYGPRISRVGGRISAEDEVDLYARAHCYLQPSRGEGFGLQPLQAIAQGLPTVLTGAHGHAAFAHLGWPLDSKLVKSGYFLAGDAGEWWEPDLDQLCERMRWMYDHYEKAARGAATSAVIAADLFTWDRTAQAFVDAIGRDRLERPYTGDGRWTRPAVRRYLVRVERPWQADIAGDTYRFEPDVDYWEVADVKRVLFEGGLLSPSCLNPRPGGEAELGLTEEQCLKLDSYTAAHSFCPTCHQQLNSGIARADMMLAEIEAAR